MINRELAKVLIRNRKIMDFIWNWIHKPILLFWFLLSIIHIINYKL